MSEAVCMNNMEYMAKFPDKFFDLGIADPPYFTGPNKRKFYGKAVSTTSIKRKDYPITPDEEWKIPDQQWLNEFIRVTKHQIIWGINYMPFTHCAGIIIWDKRNGNSSFSDAEIASCTFHDSVRMFVFMWSGMCQGKSITEGHLQKGNKKENQQKIHPTEKPFELYDWIYKKYLPEGGKVLDPYLVSGSSRISADKAGNIDFYGCEISPIHFKNQEKRWKEYSSQLKLFLQYQLIQIFVRL